MYHLVLEEGAVTDPPPPNKTVERKETIVQLRNEQETHHGS